jgi:hypothetical protein
MEVTQAATRHRVTPINTTTESILLPPERRQLTVHFGEVFLHDVLEKEDVAAVVPALARIRRRLRRLGVRVPQLLPGGAGHTASVPEAFQPLTASVYRPKGQSSRPLTACTQACGRYGLAALDIAVFSGKEIRGQETYL